MSNNEIAELKAMIEELKAEVAAMRPAKPYVSQPTQRFDPTANFTMPQSAIDAMTAVVGDKDLASIVREQRSGVAQPSGLSKPNTTEQPKPAIGKNGWIDERPISPPPGVRLIDQIAQAFSERERRER